MGCNPHANGGLLLRELRMPDFREYAVPVPAPGVETAEATRALGRMLRDTIEAQRRTISASSVRTRPPRTVWMRYSR